MKSPKEEIRQINARNRKVHSRGLQRYRWRYGPIFTRLAVVASQICEIPQNSLKIRAYTVQGHRSGINQKRICNFLLVINFWRIS